jgi:hypothetical protein
VLSNGTIRKRIALLHCKPRSFTNSEAHGPASLWRYKKVDGDNLPHGQKVEGGDLPQVAVEKALPSYAIEDWYHSNNMYAKER